MAKILLMEDDVEQAVLLCDTLIMLGHSVELSYDAYDAIEKFDRGGFELLIIDLLVNGGADKGGIHFIQMLKKHHAYRENRIPVITVSGSTFGTNYEKLENRMRVLGASIHMQKPFSGQELQRKIEMLLGRDEPKDVI